jgi:hypothetical protein
MTDDGMTLLELVERAPMPTWSASFWPSPANA